MSAVNGPSSASSGPIQAVESMSNNLWGAVEQFRLLGLSPERILDAQEDVLELPPEERFTDSIAVLEEHFIDGAASDVAFELDDGARSLTKQLLPTFVDVFDEQIQTLQDNALNVLLATRDEDAEALVVAVYFEQLREAWQVLYEEALTPDGVDRVTVSTLLALNSRLMDVHSEPPEGIYADLAADAAYGEYYLAQVQDREAPSDPADLSSERIEQRVRVAGAVLAYKRLNISVNRGAELAEMSRDEFEAALLSEGVQPRQGPDANEPLWDDDEDWF